MMQKCIQWIFQPAFLRAGIEVKFFVEISNHVIKVFKGNLNYGRVVQQDNHKEYHGTHV